MAVFEIFLCQWIQYVYRFIENSKLKCVGLDFVNFGSKTYLWLFTYLCRQFIKLALYAHFNSAKKSIL